MKTTDGSCRILLCDKNLHNSLRFYAAATRCKHNIKQTKMTLPRQKWLCEKLAPSPSSSANIMCTPQNGWKCGWYRRSASRHAVAVFRVSDHCVRPADLGWLCGHRLTDAISERRVRTTVAARCRCGCRCYSLV